MAERRHFHLGDVLSITTGRLLSPDRIGGVYEILNYMTRDNLFTHQLGRASEECKPWLIRQHPQLAEIVVPETVPDNDWMAYLSTLVEKYGYELPVDPIPHDDHRKVDPVTELRELRPDAEIITVEIDRA